MKKITKDIVLLTFLLAQICLKSQVVPTNEWVSFYSSNSTLNGQPIKVGDVIRVYDNDNILCGEFVVHTVGYYGFLNVYRDDFTTPNLDEGADPGDTLKFTINDHITKTLGPNEPIWTTFGETIELDLEAHVNWSPLVSDIPDQTIEEGELFTAIKLDDYVEDIDNSDSEMEWSWNGHDELTVNMDENRILKITIPNENWNGSEIMTFTATDPGGLIDSAEVTFTVIAINDPPQIIELPDFEILEGETFEPLNLNEYVIDSDDSNDSISWSITDNNELTVLIENNILVIIQPDSNWFGTETINLFAEDPHELKDSTEIKITVNPVNDAPMLIGMLESIMFPADSSYLLNVWDYTTDVDNKIEELTFTFSASSDSLRMEYFEETGILELSSDIEFSGECILIIKVSDGMYSDEDSILVIINEITGVDLDNNLPSEYTIFQNYPNPFNPSTKIKYSIPQKSFVQLIVYNVLGKEVATLVNEEKSPGYYEIEFNAGTLPSGIYFYRIEADSFNETKKFILLK